MGIGMMPVGCDGRAQPFLVLPSGVCMVVVFDALRPQAFFPVSTSELLLLFDFRPRRFSGSRGGGGRLAVGKPQSLVSAAHFSTPAVWPETGHSLFVAQCLLLMRAEKS